MGSSNINNKDLSIEDFRIETYDESFTDIKYKLAKAGFYYARNGQNVKCFKCGYELDTRGLDSNVDVIMLHKERKPGCEFASALDPIMNVRSKKFLSYDSLRYERERVETFIDWPIEWLLPAELAADGFYYLRTQDHCACVFCRGIVGAWEVGDTPRGEHHRHFPHCPFIRGQPVGNVLISHSSILDRLPLDGEECPIPPPRCEFTVDEAGAGPGRHMPGSYSESRVPERKGKVNFDNIGLPKYTGPKRKDYITKDSRLKSYSRWPERVAQTPEEMAESGFFYCGLSDHVRCFHCGNGLRNWEVDDKPWEEHARWYPDCNFVILSKGQEFIDKVRREKPPYVRSPAARDGKPQQVAASSGRFKPVSESDLDPLMKLDIMHAVSGMGFPPSTIRKALRHKLEQTGLPFFSLEPCIEAVLQLMEEETRQTLQNSSNSEVESEAREMQNNKMQALSNQPSTPAPAAAPVTALQSVVIAGPSHYTDLHSASPNASSSTPSPPPQSPSTATESVENSSSALNHVASDTVNDTLSQSNSPTEAMETDEPADDMEMQAESVPRPTVMESETLDLPHAMRQAEDAMNAANKALNPVQSRTSSLEMKIEGPGPVGVTLEGQPPTSVTKSPSSSSSKSSTEDIAAELERMRESRMCKICMDAEMNVVFLPCQHMATCSSCAATMAQCPICRMDIKYTIKPIFS